MYSLKLLRAGFEHVIATLAGTAGEVLLSLLAYLRSVASNRDSRRRTLTARNRG